MVTSRTRLWQLAGAVPDPELPVLSLGELGVLRDVSLSADGSRAEITLTPTYSGCPAVDSMRADIAHAVRQAGVTDVTVRTVLSPPWSTDDISETGRRKLREAGIAPPGPAGAAPGPVLVPLSATGPATRLATERAAVGTDHAAAVVRCPRCDSADTTLLSRFSGTACKALRRCEACREPFDHVKPH